MFVLAAMVVTNVYPQFIQQHTHSDGDIVAKLDESIVTLPLHPKVDKIQGLNHYYMLPSENNTAMVPLGVLVYLHSCRQSGLEVFHLPESRIVIQKALEKGLVVFAPSSFHRESGCYTELDSDYLPRIVQDWTRNHRLDALPRVGMGESSGASFLFFVHKELDLKSMAVYNTPQIFPDEEWDTAIPTTFLTMPLDDPVATRTTKHVQMLKQHNISSQLYKVTSRPFTDSLCAVRFPELPRQFCQVSIFQALRAESNLLLNADGFAQGTTDSKPWEKFFRKLEAEYLSYRTKVKVPSPYDTNRAGVGHSWLWAVVEHEIQSCQGYHAMTAAFHEDILQFLLQTAEIGVEEGT
jgi:hypothetical protein